MSAGCIFVDPLVGRVDTWRKERCHDRKRELLDKLVRSQTRLIRSLTGKAARQEKSQEDFDDLLQAGKMGAARAFEGWNHEKGAFSTYAAFWVRHQVQAATRASRPIKLPRVRLAVAERTRVLAMLRKRPDLTAEQAGVDAIAFRDLKTSFGLRFLTTSETAAGIASKGARMLEASGALPSPEDLYADAERMAEVDKLVGRFRPGATAVSLGIAPEIFALVREVGVYRLAYDRAQQWIARIDAEQKERGIMNVDELKALLGLGPKSNEELVTAGATRSTIKNALKAGIIEKGKDGRKVLFGLPGAMPAPKKKVVKKPKPKPAMGPGLAKTNGIGKHTMLGTAIVHIGAPTTVRDKELELLAFYEAEIARLTRKAEALRAA